MIKLHMLCPTVSIVPTNQTIVGPNPLIKHEFAKQLLQYCLIKLLNEDENASQIAYKVGEQPFCTFKSVIKYKIISSYNNTCIDPENCVSCQRGNIDSVEGI